MNLLDRLRSRASARDITSVDDYALALNQFTYGGLSYGYLPPAISGITQTLAGQRTELAPNNFIGLATAAYETNGVVFACMMVRQLVFSSVRFRWQSIVNGKPADMFGTSDLQLLERPWVGGTTQDLLSRMIQDADLAGNSYWTVVGGELVRLRPDWVDVLVAPREMPDGRGQVGWQRAGYVYTEGGRGVGDPVGLLPDEVAHFAPIPDPLASYRGMSWLTPILREIRADLAMTRHQQAFMDNGCTPNMVVKHAAGASEEAVKAWLKTMESKFQGPSNAYKTLQLYPGADVTPVGADFKQIDFANVRNGGEARIAAAAGVPPVIAGLTPGLESSTYSNYSQARRRLADGTAHPLWQNMAGSMEQIIPRPRGTGVRLWYDADDVPFLREDEKDAADIAATTAATINSYITAGYEPDSVVKAVESNDLRLLKHSGLYSVQLWKPGQDQPSPASTTNGQAQGGVLNGASN